MSRKLLAELVAVPIVLGAVALLVWFATRPTPAPEPLQCPSPVEVVLPDGALLWCRDASLADLLERFDAAACRDTVVERAQAQGTPLRLFLDDGCQVTLQTPALSPTVLFSLGRPLDLNAALAADLTVLDGIGEALAARIVAERETNGPFCQLSDLARVKGIGPKTVARIEGQGVSIEARCD